VSVHDLGVEQWVFAIFLKDGETQSRRGTGLVVAQQDFAVYNSCRLQVDFCSDRRAPALSRIRLNIRGSGRLDQSAR
jgi:hypothetical protein